MYYDFAAVSYLYITYTIQLMNIVFENDDRALVAYTGIRRKLSIELNKKYKHDKKKMLREMKSK